MKKNHIEHIEVARGIAIIGVVTIHVAAIQSTKFDNTTVMAISHFSRFAVPLFLLISGYLHKPVISSGPYELRGYFPALKQRFRRLILPYFLFSIVYGLIRLVIFNVPIFENFTSGKTVSVFKLFCSILTIHGNPSGHLYFLPLLFFISTTYLCFERLINSQRALLIVCLSLSLTSYLFWGDIYLSLNPLKGLGIYALGRFLFLNSFLLKKNFLSITVLLASTTYMILFLVFQHLPAHQFFLFPYHLSGCVAFFVASKGIANSNQITFLKKMLFYIGGHSFSIYLLHEPYIISVLFNVFVGVLRLEIIIPVIFLSGIFLPILVTSKILVKIPFYNAYFLGKG